MDHESPLPDTPRRVGVITVDPHRVITSAENSDRAGVVLSFEHHMRNRYFKGRRQVSVSVFAHRVAVTAVYDKETCSICAHIVIYQLVGSDSVRDH